MGRLYMIMNQCCVMTENSKISIGGNGMREIKFRGKSIETGEWVYGYYVYTHARHRIIYEDYEGFYCEEEVDPETVGQYISLKDYAGDDIYEGDIVEVVISNKPKRFEVLWDEGGAMFLFAPLFKTKPMGAIDFYELEDEYGKVIVIGNKFENPELLEGTE